MPNSYKRDGRYFIDVHKFGRVALGRNRADAEYLARHIDRIWRTQKTGRTLDPESISFLENVDASIRNRLRKIGLIESNNAATIKDIASMHQRTLAVKNSTETTYKQAVASLFEFFGEHTMARDVKIQDALEFRAWMLREGSLQKNEDGKRKGLARATVSKRIKTCRSIFKTAITNKILIDNPFEGVVAGHQTNKKRSFYVDPGMSAGVVQELPNTESRLIFALGRWLGVRLPGEALELRWSDVNWQRSSIRVTAPKTERYEGKDVRVVPIFTEFYPFLREAFEQAAEGSQYLCEDLRLATSPCQVFTKTLKAAICNAGYEVWPKLLINLRATRATEVDSEYGQKCESEWIGHGADVALKSYLMQTDEAWQRATGKSDAVVQTATPFD